MKESLNIAKYVLIALALVLVIAGFLAKTGKLGGPRAKIDSLQGDFEMFQVEPVDPALVGYDGIQQIKVNLSKLTALAVHENKLYVAGDSTLLILSQTGNEIRSLSLERSAKCLAISPDNRVYVGFKNKIKMINPENFSANEFAELENKAEVTSIAATATDVFVADAGNRVVLRYNTKGDLLNQIGEKSPEWKQTGFIVPSPYFDVAIGHEGLLWAVNPGRLSLQNYSFDGQLRSSWEGTTTGIEGFCGCCNPSHVAILSNGFFVTSEKGIARVKVYDQTGKFQTVVAGPGEFIEGTVGLDLAVDNDDRIYVLDPGKKMVRVFAKKIKS